MKTNLRVKVRYWTCMAAARRSYEYALYLNNRTVLYTNSGFLTKAVAIKKGKAFAKKCGVPFDIKIGRHTGC